MKDIKTIATYRKDKLTEAQMIEMQYKYFKDKDDMNWYSKQFHSLLMMITKGTPYALVDNTETECGFEAWRRLHEGFALVTPPG